MTEGRREGERRRREEKKMKVEKTYDVSEELASDVLSSSLVVIHDTSRGGKDDKTETSGFLEDRIFNIHRQFEASMHSREGGREGRRRKLTRKEQVDPRLDLVNLDVESRRDDSGLVESSVELDNDLTSSVVVDDLEVTDVS